MPARGSGIGRLARDGFTLIELTVTLVLLLVVSMTAAVGLTSRIPNLKLRANAAQVLDKLTAARELARYQKQSQKVRFHQTRQAATVDDLFQLDDAVTYGTHQFVFARAVYAWFQSQPNPQAPLPSRLFPAVVRAADYWDAGLPGTAVIEPMMSPWNMANLPPPENHFPNSLASLRMPEAVELDVYVRIVAVNGRPTYGASATNYAGAPWTQPIPSSPAPLTGTPPQPSPGTYNTSDDRIADATYSPDGVFRFAPKAAGNADYTLTLATAVGAVTLTEPDAITLTIDRVTGVAHY